jgi:hypothetical protein
MARRYKKSDSGRYVVSLMRAFPPLGLRPGSANVTEATLKKMLDEEGLVSNVVPAP